MLSHSRTRTGAIVLPVAAAVAVLPACAPSHGDPGAEPAPTVTVTSTATPAPVDDAPRQRYVDDPDALTCDTLITPERLDKLTGEGLAAIEERDRITPGSIECGWGRPGTGTEYLDYYAYAPITSEYRAEQMAAEVTPSTKLHFSDPATGISYREDHGGGIRSVWMSEEEMFIVFGFDNLESVAPLVSR